MTYKEKKSLYESIMKEVAKTVKRNINEEDSSSSAKNRYEQIVELFKKLDQKYGLAAVRKILEFVGNIFNNKDVMRASFNLFDAFNKSINKNDSFIQELNELINYYISGNYKAGNIKKLIENK